MKPAAAAAAGVELEEDPQLVAWIKERFAAEGIAFAFPTRTLHLETGSDNSFPLSGIPAPGYTTEAPLEDEPEEGTNSG